MKQRKQIVIDKKYQHGKSFAITVFSAFVIAFVVIAVGGTISINNNRLEKNNRKIAENSKTVNSLIQSQHNSFDRDTLHSGEGKQLLAKGYSAVLEKLNNTISLNQDIIGANMKIMSMNTWLIIAILVISIAGMGLLYWRLIHETHRISGPLFVMSRHIKEVLNDEVPDMRDLRDNDEFKEFYELFRQMVEKFNQKG